MAYNKEWDMECPATVGELREMLKDVSDDTLLIGDYWNRTLPVAVEIDEGQVLVWLPGAD